jgi:hypothetical protein
MKRFTLRIARQLRAERIAEEKHWIAWAKLRNERDIYRGALETISRSTAICARDAINVAVNALKAGKP